MSGADDQNCLFYCKKSPQFRNKKDMSLVLLENGTFSAIKGTIALDYVRVPTLINAAWS